MREVPQGGFGVALLVTRHAPAMWFFNHFYRAMFELLTLQTPRFLLKTFYLWAKVSSSKARCKGFPRKFQKAKKTFLVLITFLHPWKSCVTHCYVWCSFVRIKVEYSREQVDSRKHDKPMVRLSASRYDVCFDTEKRQVPLSTWGFTKNKIGFWCECTA